MKTTDFPTSSIQRYLNDRNDAWVPQLIATRSGLPVLYGNTTSDSFIRPRRQGRGTSMMLGGNDSLAALTTASGSDITRSISTSRGVDKLPTRTLEMNHQGALEVVPIREPPIYECPFNFLSCRRVFSSSVEWRDHSITHFQGLEPPKICSCPFCDKTFEDPNGWRTWTLRCEHVELHHRLSHRLAIGRIDLKLVRYLWESGLMSLEAWDDLVGRSRSHSTSNDYSTLEQNSLSRVTGSRADDKNASPFPLRTTNASTSTHIGRERRFDHLRRDR